MNLRFALLGLFLLLTSSGFAQLAYEPMRWGEVSAADLAMRTYVPDTSAQSLVLGDQGYMDIRKADDGSYRSRMRRHKRIKILSEAALEQHGDVVFYYVHKEGRDRFQDVEAQAITPDGEIIPLRKNDFFREKMDDTWTKLTFGFPAVPVGSILEFRYERYSKSVLSPRPWHFRDEIPVRSSYFEFSCKVPVTYTYLLRGAEYMKAEKQADGREELRLGPTRISVDGTRFWLRDGAAVREESFMTALDDYFINVRFQASAFTDGYGIEQSVYSSWEETAQELINDEDLGHNFNKKRKYKNLLAKAETEIDPQADPQAILYAINRLVAREIEWSGKEGIWTKQTPDQAFAKHSGSVAEIQYAGIALLRAFGIEAYPILLSTRSNGSMITSFPFLRQFNYVLVMVEIDDVARLVDFTDPLLPPGMIRSDALNGLGFMLHDEKPAWMSIGISVVRDVYIWQGKITSEGNIEGHMKATMYTISGRNDRSRMQEASLSEIWADRLPSSATIKEITAEATDDVREPLIISCDFELLEAGFTNDDFLYVSPFLFSGFAENPFKSEARAYPVNFPYPLEEKSIYQYELPDGYIVESLPEEKTIVLPDADAQFQFKAQEKNGKISLLSILKIRRTVYEPEEYTALRELFEEAAKIMEEQVVLRKE